MTLRLTRGRLLLLEVDMAERQGAGKGKKGRKIGTNKTKCDRYKSRGQLKKNKDRKALKRKKHLAKAKARREKKLIA